MKYILILLFSHVIAYSMAQGVSNNTNIQRDTLFILNKHPMPLGFHPLFKYNSHVIPEADATAIWGLRGSYLTVWIESIPSERLTKRWEHWAWPWPKVWTHETGTQLRKRLRNIY